MAQPADTASWQIETTDLTELNVAQVHAGDRVALTFDALPNVELSGRVLQIKQFGENHQGDIIYRALLMPDIKSRTLLCKFLVWPLAGFAGQRPHQKKVLRGRIRRPGTPTTCTLSKQI